MPSRGSREVTLTDGGEKYTIWLGPKDFEALRLFARGEREVIHHSRQFAALHKLGLATHQFTRGDWPKALAVLTAQGREALEQDPSYHASITA